MNVSRSIANTVGGSLSATGTFKGGSVTATINVSQTVTTGTSKADSTQAGYSQTGNGSITVPGKQRIIALFNSYKIQGAVPFTIPVFVDGNLGQNSQGHKKLSDVLSESDRTFEISGNIVSDDYSKARFEFYALPMENSYCVGQVGLITQQFSPSADTKLKAAKLKINDERVQ